jgi:hypothetical protein
MKRVIILLFASILLQNCQKEEAPIVSSVNTVAPAPVEVSLFNKKWAEANIDKKTLTYQFSIAEGCGEYYKFFTNGDAVYNRLPSGSGIATGSCGSSGSGQCDTKQTGTINTTEQNGTTFFTTTVGNLVGRTWHIVSMTGNSLVIKAEN